MTLILQMPGEGCFQMPPTRQTNQVLMINCKLSVVNANQRTAEKVVKETPLPHEKVVPLTPQLPLEEVMVKLDVVPEIV